MGSTVQAGHLGILERGELTRGPLEESIVLLPRTGPAVAPDVQVEQSIVLQQALAGPAAVREQALLGHRRVMDQSLGLVVVTRVVVVTRAAAAGIVAITKGTNKSVKCEMPREA